MKPFVFRLQTAMDMKIHQEEEAKRDLEQANGIYVESVRQLKELQNHLVWVMEELRELQNNSINVVEVKRYQDFIPVINERIARQTLEVEKNREQVNAIRAKLVEIMKERKVLEKIKARHYQEYLRQALLEEQKQIDEMALQRFFRKDDPT